MTRSEMHTSYKWMAATILALLAATGTASASGGNVQIPIRWCAVQGSQAVMTPACSCGASTSFVVLARQYRAAQSYVNCDVQFRGAGQPPLGVPFMPNVQVIADPCDPGINPACAGAQGDIVADLSTSNFTEYFQALGACRAAWNAAGIGAVGLVGVNIRRFVSPAGVPNNVAGLGGTPQFCNNASQAVGGQFAVVDDDYTLDLTNYPQAGGNVLFDACPMTTPHPATPPCLPQIVTDSVDVLTAHEIGHALSLPHLAGTAMNATIPAPAVLTMGGFGMQNIVCPAQPFPSPTSQCGTVRLQAMCHQNGTVVDPPPVVDEEPFTIGDVSPGHVDLDLAGLINDGNTGSASVFWRATGGFPASASGLVYEFAIDLDQNPGSGGDPSTAGISIPLSGAELAGSVTVDVIAGVPSAFPQLWRWDGGVFSFVPEPEFGSLASQGTVFVDEFQGGTSKEEASHAAVSIDFDQTLLVGAPATYTMRVRAFDPNVAAEDLPPTFEMYMLEPILPLCSVLPDSAAPGQMIIVEANDLTPSQNTVVWFEKGGLPLEVAAGSTDPGGFTSSAFVVPPDAAPGRHQVSVLIDHPTDVVSADCVLEVISPAGTPGEPSSAGGTMMTITSFDPATGDVTIDFDPACEASEHAIYEGDLSAVSSYGYDSASCNQGASGTASFKLEGGSRFFVVVGQNGDREGSYGLDSSGAERPEDVDSVIGVCSLEQEFATSCP